MTATTPPRVGRVFLVGAGPGDPGLLTLRGRQCLVQADVVLYDYLANEALLEFAEGAELICLGRHGQGRIWSQAEINARLVELALAGRTVVRLKGGDPAVFARAAEEVEALAAHGIPWEIVPGITAALAAGSHAGIPLTHRDVSSAVAFITAQERPDKPDVGLDYAALARFPGTLVFYMGVTSARHWSAALLAAGKSPQTPVALVRRCSWPDQHVERCTLATAAERLDAMRPPVIAIVGDVVAAAPTLSWFEKRPLFGQRVLVTRAVDQIDNLRHILTEQGAQVLVQPAIEIGPPCDAGPLDAALARLHEFDWIVFSSGNGVQAFFDRLWERGGDARRLGSAKIAAIGPGTAAYLEGRCLRVDCVPPEFRAEALAAALAGEAAGKRFLLVRASRGREVLADSLAAAGGVVEQVVAYNSVDVTAPRPEVLQQLEAGGIDWITVTSSAIARSLARMFGENLRRARLASISPVTSATLRELGFAPAAEAQVYTMNGIVAAIVASRPLTTSC